MNQKKDFSQFTLMQDGTGTDQTWIVGYAFLDGANREIRIPFPKDSTFGDAALIDAVTNALAAAGVSTSQANIAIVQAGISTAQATMSVAARVGAETAQTGAVAAAESVGSFSTLALANAKLTAGGIPLDKGVFIAGESANNGFWINKAGTLVRDSVNTVVAIGEQINPTQLVSFGRTTALPSVTGAAPAFTYVRAQPAPKSGVLRKVSIQAAAAGSITVKVRKLINGVLKQLAPDVVVTVPASGLQVLDLPTPIAIQAGDFAGVYGPGVMQYQGGAPGYIDFGFYEAAGNVGDLPAGAIGGGNEFAFGVFVDPMSYADAILRVGEHEALIRPTVTQITGRSTALASVTGGLPSKVYVLMSAAAVGGVIGKLMIHAAAAGTAYLKAYDWDGYSFTQAGADLAVTIPASGFQTISNLSLPLRKGQFVGVFAPGILGYLGGGGAPFSYLENGATGNAGNFAPTIMTPSNGNDIGLGVEIRAMTMDEIRASAADITLAKNQAAAAKQKVIPSGYTAIGRSTALPTVDGTLPAKIYVRMVPMPSNGVIDRLLIDAAGAGTVFLKVYDFIDGVRFARFGSDISVTVPGAGFQEIRFATAVPVKAGQYIGMYGLGVQRFRGGGASASGFLESTAGNLGDFTPTSTTPSFGNDIGFAVGFRGMSHDEAVAGLLPLLNQSATSTAVAPPQIGETISEASVVISGTTATVLAKVLRNGLAAATYTGAPTITLAAAGKVRYDILALDMVAGTFSIVQGTARSATTPIDPTVYSPEATLTLQQAPIAKLRVTSSAATAILQHDLVDGTLRSLATEMQQRRTRSQGRLRRFRGGMGAAKPLRIIAVGDSVSALQYAATDSSLYTAPNGPIRDRASDNTNPAAAYLPVNYGSDYLATIPLYTSLQLGRANDGAGAVHTRIGWNWELVAALEARGYVLGTDLRYDNFAVGGQQTSGLVSGSTPSAWMNAVTALVTSSVSAGDRVLVVLSFGLNELGNVDTATRMQTIIGLLKAVGADVIVMGLARPLDSFSAPTNQQYTNRALARAAEVAGAAFAPIYDLVDGERLRSMGIFAEDLAEANHLHHPGVTELAFYGRELARHAA